MATVVYRNAVVLVSGVALQGALNELTVDYKAEMLDETTFGDDTRMHRGGLYMATIKGNGFFDGDVNIEQTLFNNMGTDDVIFAVFPDAVTEGGTTTGMGYAMKGVLSDFHVGEAVGNLLKVTFSAESRGLAA